MIRNLLKLADGTQVFSGGEGPAVKSVKLTQNVNQGEDLTLGSVCAAGLEATLMGVPWGKINAGDTVTLYTVDDDGRTQQQGVFIAEKPERIGSYTLRLTAWDNVTLLDADLTDWLAGLSGWPYTLYQLLQMVCQRCGITLLTQTFPNADYLVEKFTPQGITGRQLVRWVAEASGRYAFANAQGQLELGWYAPADVQVGITHIPAAAANYLPGDVQLTLQNAVVADAVSITSNHIGAEADDAGNVTLLLSKAPFQLGCLQGKLQPAEFTVAAIEKVQIRMDEQDVGTVYPADSDMSVNTYQITGNLLLAAPDAQKLVPVAQTLYEILKDIRYTPCTLSVPATGHIRPGQIVNVTDANGNSFDTYIMGAERSGQLLTLTCAGTPNRESTRYFNDVTKNNLAGKVLRLRTDVDGLLVQNSDNEGALSQLSMDLQGIAAQVQTQQNTAGVLQTQLTQLEQTAGEISATVKSVTDDGVSKLTTAFGLSIDGSAVRICRSGTNMENQLSETGMYVVRNPGSPAQTVMLKADADGVLATDVSVRNFLCVGDHARFEDYGYNRTACFYLGG